MPGPIVPKAEVNGPITGHGGIQSCENKPFSLIRWKRNWLGYPFS